MGVTSKGRTYRGRKTRKVQIRRKRIGIPKETLEKNSWICILMDWNSQGNPEKNNVLDLHIDVG